MTENRAHDTFQIRIYVRYNSLTPSKHGRWFESNPLHPWCTLPRLMFKHRTHQYHVSIIMAYDHQSSNIMCHMQSEVGSPIFRKTDSNYRRFSYGQTSIWPNKMVSLDCVAEKDCLPYSRTLSRYKCLRKLAKWACITDMLMNYIIAHTTWRRNENHHDTKWQNALINRWDLGFRVYGSPMF